MKALQRLKVTSLLMVIVILATLFVPAVSAKADIPENKESAAAVDISKEISVSEEDLKKASENVNVLKETDTEK
jgi:competence protein ComGC